MRELKQLPILGKKTEWIKPIPALGDEIATIFKRSLQKQQYPIDRCLRFCDYFMEVQENIISEITPETLLIPVPSTSGKNKLPGYFANQIADLRNCSIIDNNAVKTGKRDVAKTWGEAKNANSLEYRNFRFAPYVLNDKLLAECKEKSYEKILLIDDMITTGETVVNLSKQLEANGLKVNAAFGMVIFGNSYPKLPDLKEKVTDKVSALLSLRGRDALAFSRQVEKVFGEYTEIRLNREIKNGSFNTMYKAVDFKKTVETAHKNILTLEKKIENKINLDNGFNISL